MCPRPSIDTKHIVGPLRSPLGLRWYCIPFDRQQWHQFFEARSHQKKSSSEFEPKKTGDLDAPPKKNKNDGNS